MKVIKEEFKDLGLLKINDDLFAYDTPLRAIFNEFNRLREMDDDLFTYEVGIPRLSFISCDKFVRLIDVTVEQWLELKYGDQSTVSYEENKEKSGDDELVLPKKELSDLEDENLIDENEFAETFNFETPICKAFNKFNYLLKIDADLLTNDIHGFKTAYMNTNIDANYNPYLDVSRIFNSHAERNEEEAIREEREPKEDHDIGNLDNGLVRDNAPYHASEEEERYD
nr:hypothetical protein [Tanacetum cinerariifolium]